MSIDQLITEGAKTQISAEKFKRDDFRQTLVFGAGYLVTEAAEVYDHLHRVAFRDEELDRDHVKEELGDLLYAMGIIIRELDFNFDEIVDDQIGKIKSVYGDDGYSVEKNGIRKSIPYNGRTYHKP